MKAMREPSSDSLFANDLSKEDNIDENVSGSQLKINPSLRMTKFIQKKPYKIKCSNCEFQISMDDSEVSNLIKEIHQTLNT